MVNRGVAPLDPATEVGKFRALAGDTEYKPLDPPEAGFGDYEKWSDAEIEVFLSTSDSMSWAIYAAYLQLATSAALASKEISDYDLKVSTTKRADQLLAIAREWKDRADDDDNAAGASDIFEVFDMAPQKCRHELAERCRC